MSQDEYIRERERLLEVLDDAMARGDIYLEYNVREALDRLQDRYYLEDEE